MTARSTPQLGTMMKTTMDFVSLTFFPRYWSKLTIFLAPGLPLFPSMGYAFATVLCIEIAAAIFLACGFAGTIAWEVCSRVTGFVKRLFTVSSTLSPAQRVARLHNQVLRTGRVEDDGQLRYSLDSMVQFDQDITDNKNNLESELRTRITHHDDELRDRDAKLSTADNKYQQLEQEKSDQAKQFAQEKVTWDSERTELEKVLAIRGDSLNLWQDLKEQERHEKNLSSARPTSGRSSTKRGDVGSNISKI